MTPKGEWGVREVSLSKAVAIPATLALLMLLIAAGLSGLSGVRPQGLFEPYLSSWAVVTFLCLMTWAFVEVLRMARAKVEHPIPPLWEGFKSRLPLLPVPALFSPLFLAGYTWAKCSIPFLVGYGWEEFWADADRMLLGRDGWQVAHAVMPTAAAPFWSFFYSLVWGFALVFSGTLIFAFGSRRETATFFTALMLTWMVGGVGLAYAMSAGGPVFAHLTDPALSERFEPMRAQLVALLGERDVVMTSQRYLAAAIDKPYAAKGAGISAMPSMHIATATILLLACWRSWLRPVAGLFWLMTFFGSVYFGYHYALDAPVAALVALLSWYAATRYFSERPVRTGQLPEAPALPVR